MTCRSKSNFSGPPYNPLQAVYSFEQNGFIPKWILRGTPLGRIFASSLPNQFFQNPIYSTLSRLQFSTKRLRPIGGPEGKFLGCIFTRSLQKLGSVFDKGLEKLGNFCRQGSRQKSWELFFVKGLERILDLFRQGSRTKLGSVIDKVLDKLGNFFRQGSRHKYCFFR